MIARLLALLAITVPMCSFRQPASDPIKVQWRYIRPSSALFPLLASVLSTVCVRALFAAFALALSSCATTPSSSVEELAINKAIADAISNAFKE